MAITTPMTMAIHSGEATSAAAAKDASTTPTSAQLRALGPYRVGSMLPGSDAEEVRSAV